MKIHQNKGFTLIELIVVIAILAILVLLGIPKMNNYQKEARLTNIKNNIKVLEGAAELYYLDHLSWPRSSSATPLTKEELETYAEEFLSITGEPMELDENGKYYSLEYNLLGDYVQKPKDGFRYLIQNPIGDIVYMNNFTELGKTIFNYDKDETELPKEPSKVDVSDVTINSNSSDMLVGEKMVLTATVVPINATNKIVNWSSSNHSVAIIDSSSGEITAVANGTSIITVKTENNITASISIHVKTINEGELIRIVSSDTENGYVLSDSTKTKAGEIITLTPVPQPGYEVVPGSVEWKKSTDSTWTTGETFSVPLFQGTTKYTTDTTINVIANHDYNIVARGEGHGVSAKVSYMEDKILTIKFVNGSTWVYDGTPSTYKSTEDREATLLVGAAQKGNYPKGDSDFSASYFNDNTYLSVGGGSQTEVGLWQHYFDDATSGEQSNRIHFGNSRNGNGYEGWYNGASITRDDLSGISGGSSYIKGVVNPNSKNSSTNNYVPIKTFNTESGSGTNPYVEITSIQPGTIEVRAQFRPVS